MALYPSVQQGVSGAGIEAENLAGRGKQRQVRDAADVEHGVLGMASTKGKKMKRRDQGRALPSCGQVLGSKIPYGCDACLIRDYRGITNLKAERISEFGPMKKRLAVAANRDDMLGRDVQTS